ncbi:MAG: hypothetical protein ACXACA_01395 [Candidatus Ranarchaeia archaeon]|jgi:hypothetical protein
MLTKILAMLMLLQDNPMFPGIPGLANITIDHVFLIVNGTTALLGLIMMAHSINTTKAIVELFPQGRMTVNWQRVRILLIVFQLIYLAILAPWFIQFFTGIDFQGILEPWLLPIVYVAGLAAVGIGTTVSLRTYELIKDAQGGE